MSVGEAAAVRAGPGGLWASRPPGVGWGQLRLESGQTSGQESGLHRQLCSSGIVAVPGYLWAGWEGPGQSSLLGVLL